MWPNTKPATVRDITNIGHLSVLSDTDILYAVFCHNETHPTPSVPSFSTDRPSDNAPPADSEAASVSVCLVSSLQPTVSSPFVCIKLIVQINFSVNGSARFIIELPFQDKQDVTNNGTCHLHQKTLTQMIFPAAAGRFQCLISHRIHIFT